VSAQKATKNASIRHAIAPVRHRIDQRIGSQNALNSFLFASYNKQAFFSVFGLRCSEIIEFFVANNVVIC
jgi:hypothetical protein